MSDHRFDKAQQERDRQYKEPRYRDSQKRRDPNPRYANPNLSDEERRILCEFDAAQRRP